MSDLRPEIIGEFIVLPDNQQAISIRHVSVIHVTGYEDPDKPRAKNAHLVADVEHAEGTNGYVLGRFCKFSEAEAELNSLLRRIVGI